jgi:hypothetical protein
MTTASASAPRRYPGRLLLFLGLGLAVLGVIAYVVQVVAIHQLTRPWYLPAAATLGLILVGIALWQRRNVWRVLALLVGLLLAGAAWFVVLGAPLPAYAGPVAEGKPFPKFATVRADGTPFTERDLQGDQDNVLVFFRGRW